MMRVNYQDETVKIIKMPEDSSGLAVLAEICTLNDFIGRTCDESAEKLPVIARKTLCKSLIIKE